jgi:hypothetical protein
VTPQNLLEQFIAERLLGLFNKPSEPPYGSVSPTYAPGDPRYGAPIYFPGTNTPIGLNEAEMEGLRKIRKSGVAPKMPY